MSDSHFSRPAVRDGDTYCAPWCGFGCSWKAFQRATDEAAALAHRLGDDWEPHVWENCGWHYRAQQGKCVITPMLKRGGALSGDWEVDGYMAWINTQPQFISAIHAAPEEAFDDAFKLMEAAFCKFEKHVQLARLINSQLSAG